LVLLFRRTSNASNATSRPSEVADQLLQCNRAAKIPRVPRQKAASSTIDQAIDKMESVGSGALH
jgi:hypothetical protein